MTGIVRSVALGLLAEDFGCNRPPARWRARVLDPRGRGSCPMPWAADHRPRTALRITFAILARLGALSFLGLGAQPLGEASGG
ncbi:MAG: hypothetical protein M5U08_13960 [Burkholderiales bacterium]|nr:hypothetical protein [Burkholderiales bacterium]